MIKTYKVMLLPNNKQNTKMFENANVSRWAYNWTLDRQKENYDQGNKFISAYDLMKEINILKKTKKFKWLFNIPSKTISYKFSITGNLILYTVNNSN